MTAQFDSITIWINAFIPMPSVNALGTCFSGDGRGFSADQAEQRYRARSEITVSGFLAGSPETIEFHQCGESHRIDCETDAVLESATASTDQMTFHGFSIGNTFPDPDGGVVDNPNEFCANFLYDGTTENPLIVPSPDIDMNFFFTIDPVGRTVSLRGAVNAFPDYEAYAVVDGGASITLFQHPHSLDPAFGLPGAADQLIKSTVSV